MGERVWRLLFARDFNWTCKYLNNTDSNKRLKLSGTTTVLRGGRAKLSNWKTKIKTKNCVRIYLTILRDSERAEEVQNRLQSVICRFIFIDVEREKESVGITLFLIFCYLFVLFIPRFLLFYRDKIRRLNLIKEASCLEEESKKEK